MNKIMMIGAILSAYLPSVTPSSPDWENTRFSVNFGYENMVVEDDNLENNTPEYYAYKGETYMECTYQGAQVWKYLHCEYADQETGTYGANLSSYCLPAPNGQTNGYTSNLLSATEGDSYPSNTSVTFKIYFDGRYRVFSHSANAVQVTTSLDSVLRQYSWTGDNWYSVDTSHSSYWQVTINLSMFANKTFTNNINGSNFYGAALAGWTLGTETSSLSVTLTANIVTLEQAYFIGMKDGYNNGLNAGGNVNTPSAAFSGIGDLFSKVFNGMGTLLNTELFPGFTLGWLVAIPFVFVLIAFFVRFISKGAS